MKIGKNEVRLALKKLQSFKGSKAAEDQRMRENEKWWRLKHWDLIDSSDGLKPASAWLFNSIINKHADAMDNYPEATVLPKSRDDKAAADTLTKVLPVILENCDYEKTYSDLWWDKLKYGCSVCGVFWNSDSMGGLGDIEIKRIDPKNIYFEPGIVSLEESSDVFYIESVNTERLREIYPENDLSSKNSFLKPEGAGSENKTAVVNWYYKKAGKLHFCRFAGEEVLFASENEKEYKENGWYAHGKYPFIVDSLFPKDDSPYGFGYIDTMKDSQMMIDMLGKSILENALLASKKRFFLRDDGSINEGEFLDLSNSIIHASGNLGEDSIRELTTSPLSGIYMTVMDRKIDEIKETSGNRDFSQGSTSSGVTAASAIQALQEAGNKLSRDMLKSTYRSFRDTCNIVIELIRQFYLAPRIMRITGEEFYLFDNAQLQPNSVNEFGITYFIGSPVFDISVVAAKGSSYSKNSSNEMALKLFQLGFFAPERAKEAISALEMMSFEGIDEVKSKIALQG